MGSVKFSGFSFRHGRRRISFPCLWRAVIGMATSAAMGMKTVRAEVPKKKTGLPGGFPRFVSKEFINSHVFFKFYQLYLQNAGFWSFD